MRSWESTQGVRDSRTVHPVISTAIGAFEESSAVGFPVARFLVYFACTDLALARHLCVGNIGVLSLDLSPSLSLRR